MIKKSTIYTYTNPQNWENHSHFDEIKFGIHICASKNMVNGIKNRYLKNQEFSVIFSIAKAIEVLFPNFSSSEKKLERYLSLSRTIEGMLVLEENQILKEAFKKNTIDIQETLEHLIFNGISSTDLITCVETKNEKFLYDIFKKIEDDNSWRKLKENQILNKEKVLQIFETKLDLKNEFLELDKAFKNKIILHGFYSITPEQQTVFQKLKEIGFEIVFFNLYDTRFESTFEFIKKYLSSKHGWIDFPEWTVDKSNNQKTVKLGSKFLNDYEKTPKIYTARDSSKLQEIYKYPTFFDFLDLTITKYYKIGNKSKNDTSIITTDSKLMNKLLTPYYPERYADSINFLLLPIGQFISNLHKLVEIDSNGSVRYSLHESALISLFSSGWLYNFETKTNAREYLKDLELLLPFFNSYRPLSIDEWIERFNLLLSLHKDIINDYASSDSNRIIKSIESPFSKLGYINVSQYNIGEILYFITKIKELSQKLFVENEKTTLIKTHFDKMKSLLEEISLDEDMNKTLLNEEKDIIKELLNKMDAIDSESEALIGDLHHALSLYLSGNFNSEENSFVKNFRDIDGETFTPDIIRFITCLDNESFPLAEPKFPWPLNESCYKSLSKKYSQLEYTLYRKDSIKQISRYLFYNMLEFLHPNLTEISWIENIADKMNLKENIYSSQLEMSCVLKEKEIIFEEEKELKNITFDFEASLFKEVLDKLNYYDDPKAEYKICQKRFYYGYLLNSYPIFSTQFHHKFIFGNLTKFLYNSISSESIDKTREIIFNNISPLFPQWNSYLKKMLIYRNTQKKYERIGWSSENINQIKKLFVLPGIKDVNRSYDSSENFRYETIFKSPDFEILKMESLDTEKNNCRFCPYILKCLDAYYPVDGDDKNEN